MSTETAVLDLPHRIMSNIDRGKYTVATFLDLSKTFDTLNRSILIRKLRHCGVYDRSLEWFVSYLANKKHLVNILDVYSPTILIYIGIAQGSCLDPPMFVVYMNDIVRCSIELNFLIYDDDTTLFVLGVVIGQCISTMHQGLSHVCRWLSMNKLCLNISKTN